MQWNYCDVRGKLLYLQAISHSFDVLCIQESLLWPHNSFWIRGFNSIRRDIVSSNERGTCILESDKLTYSVLNLSPFIHSSLELQEITLIHNNEPLVVNIYRLLNQFTPLSILDYLLQFLFAKFKNIIITENVKAHHSWWRCDYEDSARKIFSRLSDIHNLIIVNDHLPTTLLSPN